MEQMRGRRRTAQTNYSPQLVYEDFQPSSDWSHDSNCHFLVIDLPDFMEEEVNVQFDNGKVTVRGERKVSESKYSRFKEVFDAPENSDIDKISSQFSEGVLFVVFPQKATEVKEETERENNRSANEIEEEKKHESNNEENPKKDDENKHDHGHDYDLHNEKKDGIERNVRKEGLQGKSVEKKEKENWRKGRERMKEKEGLGILMESAVQNIYKNKAVIVTALIAFSVGFYLSHKLQSGEQRGSPSTCST